MSHACVIPKKLKIIASISFSSLVSNCVQLLGSDFFVLFYLLTIGNLGLLLLRKYCAHLQPRRYIKTVVVRCLLIGFDNTKFAKVRRSRLSSEIILRRQLLVINRKLVAIIFCKSDSSYKLY